MVNRRWSAAFTAICLVLCTRFVSAQTILYVNAAATTGANNGSSWADAFQGELGLQNALAAAAPIASGGTSVQVWVAQETYKPTADTNFNASFVLLSNVAIYGGFSGTETQLSQRLPDSNITTLSGILGPGFLERSRHVVRASTGVARSAVLDGVTVSGGYCSSAPSNDRSGGGILLSDASPTIRRVTISSNSAYFGGGVANVGGSPLFEDCRFVSNSASGFLSSSGGGFASDDGSPELVRCEFDYNTTAAQGGGGGIHCRAGTIDLMDCALANGIAEAGGAIEIASGGTVNLLRCILINNRAFGGGAVYGFGPVHARESIFSDNRITTSGSAPGARFSNSTFVNCVFLRNGLGNSSAPSGAIQASSSHFVNCKFFANQSISSVSASASTFVNCLFSANSSLSQGGILALTDSVAQYCTFSNNASNGFTVPLFGNSELTNTILWSNVSGAGQVPTGTGVVRYNVIQGWPGGGTANLTTNPLFADPLGPDGVAGTMDDDLRLLPGSPCIDSADADALPPDTYDIDNDGNTTEPLPLDLDGNPRWVDNPPSANVGAGFVQYLDRGPHEFPGAAGTTSLWNNSAGGDFLNAANWTPGVPGPADGAIFETAGAYSVQFSTDALLDRLYVRSGALIFDLTGRTLSLTDPEFGLRLAPATPQPVTLHINGGTVESGRTQVRTTCSLSGSTTFTGELQNAGTLLPGGGGTVGLMTIQGRYQQFIITPAAQTFSGTLALDVGGTDPGQYDQLITPGGYSLLGLLRINTINNFDPPPDLSLRLIDATNATTTIGTFSAVLLPALSPGPGGEFRFYYISYGGQDQGGSVFLNVGTLGGLIGYGAGVNPASTASIPTALALDDLNGDALPDLALTLPGTPGAVLVFRNLGTSQGEWLGWSSPTQYAVGNQPGGIAIGELDGQPGNDIAVSNTGNQTGTPDPGSVSLLFNNGTGAFTVQSPIALDILGEAGSAPRGIVIANLLGAATSLPDIAVALSGNPSNAIILENRGLLDFSSTPVPVGPRPTSADVADFNNDFVPDLVFSNLGDGTVTIRLNAPTSPFTTGSTLRVGALPIQVLARDLTGDLAPEIITIDEGSQTISVALNRGGGTFDPSVSLPAGAPAQTPRSFSILDMDEDGDPDIAFIAGSDSEVKIYRNDLTGGQLGLSLDAPLPTPGTALLVDSADIDGDERTDLVPIINGPADSPQAIVLNNRFRSPCFTANCDGSTGTPLLTANDFTCFINAYATGNPFANCDESTVSPVLTPNDFTCFINAFAEGCP